MPEWPRRSDGTIVCFACCPQIWNQRDGTVRVVCKPCRWSIDANERTAADIADAHLKESSELLAKHAAAMRAT